MKGIAFALDHATKGDALVNTYPSLFTEEQNLLENKVTCCPPAVLLSSIIVFIEFIRFKSVIPVN